MAGLPQFVAGQWFFPYIYQRPAYTILVTPFGSTNFNEPAWRLALKGLLVCASVVVAFIYSRSLWWKRGVEKASTGWGKRNRKDIAACLKDLLPEIANKWKGSDKVVFSDFGRLASRISIFSDNKRTHCSLALRTEGLREATTRASSADNNHEYSRVLVALADALGCTQNKPQEAADLRAALESVRPTAIFRVLQAINQSVIYPAIAALNIDILDLKLPLLDKTGPSAWLVEVGVGSTQVSVVHRRWARSCSKASFHEYFEFRYALTMTFDRSMQRMEACDLAVTEFIPGAAMPMRRQAQLTALLRI